MSRSAASRRRRTTAASAPGTGRAPACAPAGRRWARLPGAALAPQCCWALAQEERWSPRLSQAGTQPPPRAAEGPREGQEARGSGTHCRLFRAGCGVTTYRKRVPTGSQTPQLGTLTLIGHQTHRHPCLRTGWAPSPGTSASCPCGGGSGGGGGLRPGWWQSGPGRHCRAVPRGDAAAPVWR